MVDRLISSRSSGSFPFGTLAINASGALMLGLLNGISLSGDALLLSGSATIGSYTTFSTWMLETHRLGEDGQFSSGALNILVSVGVGIGAAALGRWIGGAL
jgi:fluoride exporter